MLVGYDQRERTLVLRSGNTRRWYTSFASFDDAWAGAGRWAVLIQPTEQLPAQPVKQVWLQAHAICTNKVARKLRNGRYARLNTHGRMLPSNR